MITIFRQHLTRGKAHCMISAATSLNTNQLFSGYAPDKAKKTYRLLCCSFFLLSAVLGTGLVSLCYTLCIKSTTNDVVTNTGQVLNSSATDKNNRVFLKVVSYSGDIGCYFDPVGKTNSCDFTKSRVRLLRGLCGNLCANASLLRCACVSCSLCKSVETLLKSRRLRLVSFLFTSFSD